MNINQLFSQIRSLLSNSVGVEMSFGTPTKLNDLFIIPVAKVSFGFGGGGGTSSGKTKLTSKCEKGEPDPQPDPEQDNTDKKEDKAIGGGGGGGMRTDPIGIYSIKDDKVRFHPVVGVKELILVIGVTGVLMVKIMKFWRKRK